MATREVRGPPRVPRYSSAGCSDVTLGHGPAAKSAKSHEDQKQIVICSSCWSDLTLPGRYDAIGCKSVFLLSLQRTWNPASCNLRHHFHQTHLPPPPLFLPHYFTPFAFCQLCRSLQEFKVEINKQDLRFEKV